MQKQTIIKEATTPALAGREKVYVHFHIEQRVHIVPVHFYVERNCASKCISNQSRHQHQHQQEHRHLHRYQYQHPHSVSAINFCIFGHVDGIVSYRTIINLRDENYGTIAPTSLCAAEPYKKNPSNIVHMVHMYSREVQTSAIVCTT
jgi:hypothetical protein